MRKALEYNGQRDWMLAKIKEEINEKEETMKATSGVKRKDRRRDQLQSFAPGVCSKNRLYIVTWLCCWNCPMFRELLECTWNATSAIFTNNQAVCMVLQSVLTLKVLVVTIDTQWEGMGDVEPALLPPCPTIRVLSYSN